MPLRHRLVPALLAAAVVVPVTVQVLPGARAAGSGVLRAGVGVADGTWHVGASAGQYADNPTSPDEAVQGEWDPNQQHTAKLPSYGVQSRLSIRALVFEGADGRRVAVVKTDNYLSQDMLSRRASQLLAADGVTGITNDDILLTSTHDHSSPYYSTPAAGVWLFQDVFDLRMFEYQARAIASAVEQAVAGLTPVRVGATTVELPDAQSNVVGPSRGDDGSPAGYPRSENDHGVVVMRVDRVDGTPLASWVNYAEHPESLDSYNLISGDYVAPLQRFVGRETGAPMIYSQGSVGSAEGPYLRSPGENPVLTSDAAGNELRKAWAHSGYAQAERQARLIADAVLQGWTEIGAGGGQVPFTTDAKVDMITRWTPGPLSHPYPSVSNCRTQPTVDGDPGAPVLGLPDCQRGDLGNSASPLFQSLKEAGIAIPENYDAPSFGAVEENARLKLQVLRVGEVLMASCACEAQSDLIKNIETRTNTTQHDEWLGYEFDCSEAASGWSCIDGNGSKVAITDAVHDRMVAEIHNDAAGWDDPANAATANSEPADPAEIKGNFTHSENDAAHGFALTVGIGHGSDYNGYTVSYREYMNRDSYRKALTSYGPHTADYMATKLQAMAAQLKGGPAIPAEPTTAIGLADEQRQAAEALALGQLAAAAYDGWAAQLPDDLGPVAPVTQPKDVSRFSAATFRWRGGSNYADNPTVTVEREVGGDWVPYADQSGEIQTVVSKPAPLTSLASIRTGAQEWVWTASFEAFDAYPRTQQPGGQVQSGRYRFVVHGSAHTAGSLRPYVVTSDAFEVRPWTGVTVADVTTSGSTVSASVPTSSYPITYASPIAFVADDGGATQWHKVCKTCSFRPWARHGRITSVDFTFASASGSRVVGSHLTDGRWVADEPLAPGETASIAAGGVIDEYGETNGVAAP